MPTDIDIACGTETVAAAAAEVPVPENDGKERLAELEEECARLRRQCEALQKKSLLEKVCYESGCTDAEYLEFCAARQGVPLNDPEKLRQFTRELAAAAPGCFNARITPGSSAGNTSEPASHAGNRREALNGDRIALIALSIDNAPDAVCR
ncbi:MAG: hypothetical protein E7057_05380 [Lentisphaerae bacterium]|nr:hypothetical protein [Lentisphaerota bacterium]